MTESKMRRKGGREDRNKGIRVYDREKEGRKGMKIQ